jgi:DNA-binding response OmpR family regulator
MLPDRDGVAVCRSLRASGLEAPILELTARDGIEDRVLGLNGGTDGYRLGPPSR